MSEKSNLLHKVPLFGTFREVLLFAAWALFWAVFFMFVLWSNHYVGDHPATNLQPTNEKTDSPN